MMGPIISAKQLEIVEVLVESAKKDGARIVCGGERMKGKSGLDGHDLSAGCVVRAFLTLINANSLA